MKKADRLSARPTIEATPSVRIGCKTKSSALKKRQGAPREEFLEHEENQDAVQSVQDHVEQVVTRWIFAAQGIVDGVGQHDDGRYRPTLLFHRLPVMPAEDLFEVGRDPALEWLVFP